MDNISCLKGGLASARAYRCTEDVCVVPGVITELEFGTVQGQVFGGNLVIGPGNTALQNGPKPLNGLGVDGADNILATGMVNRAVGEFLAQIPVSAMLVCAEQADPLGNALADEAGQRSRLRILNDTGNHGALAAHSASYDCFTRAATAVLVIAALVLVAVLRFAAHIGLIDLNDAHELVKLLIGETGPNAVAHIMCRPVGAETHHALNLEGGNPLFTDKHQVDDAEPHLQINVRVFENGPDKVREAVGRAHAAIHALPFIGQGLQFDDVNRAATGAANAIRPALLDQIRITGSLIGEHCLELRNGKLLNAGHGSYPLMIEAT